MKKTILAIAAVLCLCGTAQSQRHIEYKWHGAYFVVDGSYTMNLNRAPALNGYTDTLSAFNLSIIGGFQFRKESAVGLGVNYIADPTGAYTQMPVFVEIRSHFLRSRLTPYTAIQGGYCLPLGASSEPPSIQITKGGLYFGVEAGARYAINRNFGVGAHVGFKLLQSREVARTDASNMPLTADPLTLYALNFGTSLHF